MKGGLTKIPVATTTIQVTTSTWAPLRARTINENGKLQYVVLALSRLT